MPCTSAAVRSAPSAASIPRHAKSGCRATAATAAGEGEGEGAGAGEDVGDTDGDKGSTVPAHAFVEGSSEPSAQSQ